MSDPIRESAIEAAAKLEHDASTEDPERYPWETDRVGYKKCVRESVAPLVDAVLAVALPEWRKHAFELRKTAIREARAEALRDAADDFAVIPHPYEGGVTSWLRDRADAEEAS